MDDGLRAAHAVGACSTADRPPPDPALTIIPPLAETALGEVRRVIAMWLVWAVGPAQASERFAGYAFYLGDLHAHTSYSDDGASTTAGSCDSTCGVLADVWTTARDNGLDFLALTDHVNGGSAGYPQMDESAFETYRDELLAAHDPTGGLVVVPGAELFFSNSDGTRYGHKTLLLFGDNTTLAGVGMSELWPTGTVNQQSLSDCGEITTWMDTLTATYGDALLIPHHPAASPPMPTDWSCRSDAYEVATEVYSVHGSSLDESSPVDVLTKGSVSTGFVHYALETYGVDVGFTAGTDRHDTRPGEVCALDQASTGHRDYGGGLTIAMVDGRESFDRPALYDALVAHHTYATTGPMVPVFLRWRSGGAELGGLGDAVTVPSGQDLDVEVRVPPAYASYVLDVRVVTEGTAWTLGGSGATWSGSVPAADLPAWAYVEVRLDGLAWWGKGGCDDGGKSTDEYLWLSPSWFGTGAGDLDADGFDLAAGDCDDGDATIFPGAADAPYDGVDADCAGDNDYDHDGDGYPRGVDCNDHVPWIFPGAPHWSADCRHY